jgi:hypothetical protein
MGTEGNDAGDMRPSTPRRITAPGRTFGNLTFDNPVHENDDMSARESTSTDARTSGPKRITGARHAVG